MIDALIAAIAGSSIVALLFGSWLKYYFGPYLERKAKALATHEDIAWLVEQVRATEGAKGEVADSRTRRAKVNELYENTLELVASIAQTRKQLREESGREWDDGQRKLKSTALEFEKRRAVAGMVFSLKANVILDNLRDPVHGNYRDKKLDAVFVKLIDELRLEAKDHVGSMSPDSL
jgi:hypothetical protein